MRAFDLTRQHCLTPNKWVDEQVRIREASADSSKLPKRSICGRKVGRQRFRPNQFWRERIGDERPSPLEGLDQAAGRIWCERGRIQSVEPYYTLVRFRESYSTLSSKSRIRIAN